MKGRLFIPASSVAGRRLTGAKGALEADDSRIPREVLKRNRAIDQARADELARRKARRAGR